MTLAGHQLADRQFRLQFIGSADSNDEGSNSRSPVQACKSGDSPYASTQAGSCNEHQEALDMKLQVSDDEDEGASGQFKPCLLSQMQSLRSQSFKVKNTFIDDFESDDGEDDRPPMVATKSCPLQYCPKVWPHSPAQIPLAIEEEPGLPHHHLEKPAFVFITPQEQRQPEFSIGAQLHGTGTCKPCAWFWRPLGCMNGQECAHCHLCTAAELKARKKAKKLTKKLKGPGGELIFALRASER